MRFIRLNRVLFIVLPLLVANGFPKAWGDTLILPPNEQIALCGDALLQSKQICHLDTREEIKINEYELYNIVTFHSVKKTTKLNGITLPEDTLMTLITTSSPKNEFTIELDPSAQLDVYNDSDLYLTLQCNKI
jgi:hypothetical protein